MWEYSRALSTTLFIGCRAIIMLFPLDTSIPTAFIASSCVIEYGSRPFFLAACSISWLTRTHQYRGPRRSPAKRVRWGEEG